MNNRRNKGLDRIISLVALLVGVVAIYLSWEANQIAKDTNELVELQIRPHIVILSVDFNSWWHSESINGRAFHCSNKIRLSNFGGAPTSIIGQRTSFYYQNNELQISSNETLALETSIPEAFSEINGISSIYLSSATSIDQAAQRESFPIRIDAYTTIDVVIRVVIATEGSIVVWDPVNVEYRSDLSSPIEVAYTIILASGQEVTTSKKICYYIKNS